MFEDRDYLNPSSKQRASSPTREAQTSSSANGSNANQIGSISLPKGGGAIRGIGEKFTSNPVTGTASLSVPILTSPGRAGFGPQLTLNYDSGAGNGPFGLGWSLSLPSITRKTDKGIPRYQDSIDSDVFILSGAEDLVPLLVEDGGQWVPPEPSSGQLRNNTYNIRRYRPRIEGSFSRIEYWTNVADPADTFWRSISRDNITTWYGKTAESRISNPAKPVEIFSWLICESYDDKGNAIRYEYKPENSDGIDLAAANERNRSRSAQRYIKHIKYGNKTPRQINEDLAQRNDWLFEVVFDYGEHSHTDPKPNEPGDRVCRHDPFSSYRAGFEIRTYRLCQRVLMFHHFPDEIIGRDCLVKSTDFVYRESRGDITDRSRGNPIASFLASVTQSGYQQETGGTYVKKSLPALEFKYSEATVNDQVRDVDADSLENLPAGIAGFGYQLIDLEAEGIPGILTEQANSWFYKRNLSPISIADDNGVSRNVAKFAPLELIANKPAVAITGTGSWRFQDLAGNGQPDLASFQGPVAGYFELNDIGTWDNFVPFEVLPNVNWRDANLRFVDLTGDGLPDILITEQQAFTWYQSLGETGFAPSERTRQMLDEEYGPRLVFADAEQSIYLADFSGDGLTDLVRIRNGEVCYWPNLGYGRFGAKVSMDNAPWFDEPDQFEQDRVRLADIDGSGVVDILYLASDGVHFYYNQSGNSWSEARRVSSFQPIDDLSAIQVADLLGNGTACLVWSTSLPAEHGRHMRYIDLMGSQKPHLLLSVTNNMGAETRYQYAASTKFYLQDRAAGKPWITKLPFPVHVVERVETFDYVRKAKFVSLFAYHHGYFDGPAREFRGFGMVEQWDTESYSKFSGAGLFSVFPDTTGDEFHLPPTHTRTWFHNGAYFAQTRISRQFEDEYYKQDQSAAHLPDTVIPAGLSANEQCEASRALKGRILRQEIYADDDSSKSAHPFSVTEHAYQLRLIQPPRGGAHPVFLTYESEALSYHYERNPGDPRISHQLTLQVDPFGNVLKSAVIGYPRRPPVAGASPHAPEQTRTHITYNESDFTNEIDEPDDYRLPLPAEVRTYELTGITAGGSIYPINDLLNALPSATEIAYEVEPSRTATEKRLIERARTLYLKNDLSGPSTFRRLETLALPFETYKLAFTTGLLDVYQSKISKQALLTLLLGNEGGYKDLDSDGTLWIPSGQSFLSPDPTATDTTFAREHFYLPQGTKDPFGNISRVTRDAYNLLTTQTEDALSNIVEAQIDYRVLQPRAVIDPNGNRSEVEFDALGMIVATAVMGKAGQNEGDTLSDPTTRLEYDLFNWQQRGQPNFVRTLAREQHGPSNTRWQESYSYSDGLGNEIEKKVQAEPGEAPGREANGTLKRDANNKLVFEFTSTRWVGNGRTVLDNKGNPVKQYEPFFSSTAAFEDEQALVETGVTAVNRYDPMGRLIRTELPNGTFSKVEFDAWRQVTWDANDTVLQSRWYAERQLLAVNHPERKASDEAAQHANTPQTTHLDTLGRAFLTIDDDGQLGKFETQIELDFEGNVRAVIDALDRRVVTYDYDMLGNSIHQAGMDAGGRWMLLNVAGNPIRSWDDRRHQLRILYDALKRPTQFFVKNDAEPEVLAEQSLYGETQMAAADSNLRGKLYQLYDGAGVATNRAYDFKGNLLNSDRQLVQNYKDVPDWSQSPQLETAVFGKSSTFDALNRPIEFTTPDSSVSRPTYNEAGLLDRIDVKLRGATAATGFVTNIDYNARGQRELIDYRVTDANGVSAVVRTKYVYDPQTFKLRNLNTIRTTDNVVLQDLSYTYDPVGNITAIRDGAQQTVYFQNQRVEPNAEYKYDALYRLTRATGREHLGQTAGSLNAPSQPDHNDSLRTGIPHRGDGNAMGNYVEEYSYDAADNFLRMVHTAHSSAGGSWTRRYAYDESSLIEASRKNNRLSSTSLPGDSATGPYTAKYEYDEHGNITKMPHIVAMEWDFKDQMRSANLGGGGTAYYVYDAAGQRVRKVIEAQGTTTKKEERLYLGGYEIFRRYNAGTELERETLHIMDGQRRIAIVETKTIDEDAPPFTPRSLTRYQLDNHLGSASLELDAAGEIISYEEYFPFGGTSYQAVRTGVEVSPKRYRYTGKECDEETGFYYHGARYYASWLGRWTSCDPSGFEDGLNLYVYTKNNPVVFLDPNGRGATKLEDPDTVQQVTRFVLYAIEGQGKKPPLFIDPFTLLLMPGGAAYLKWYIAANSEAALALAADVAALAFFAFVIVGAVYLGVEHHRVSQQIETEEKEFYRRGDIMLKNSSTPKDPSPLDLAYMNELISDEDYLLWRAQGRTTVPVMDTTQKGKGQAEKEEKKSGGPPPPQGPPRPNRERRNNPIFMRWALEIILADPNHLLSFYVDYAARNWKSREKYTLLPTLQAGHLISLLGLRDWLLFCHMPESLALEDSTFNQWSSNVGESQGAVFEKSAISIGSIPVELRTARLLEGAGLLPPGTVANSPIHPGWRRNNQ